MEISNPQINKLYLFLTLLTAIYVLHQFFINMQYAQSMEIGQHVSSQVWVTDPLSLEAKSSRAALWESNSVCTQPENYDYQSAHGPWSYKSHSCLLPCNTTGVSSSCLSPVEEYLDVEASDVFIPTQMKETMYRSDEEPVIQSFVMPMAEDVEVSFRYSLWVRESAIRAAINALPWDWHDFRGSSSQDITTVILDQHRAIVETLQPSTSVTLSVPRLLELAGLSGMFDEPQPDAGANSLPNATYPTGPLGRITGRELALELKCYNEWGRPTDVDGLGDIDGMLCTVEVRASSEPWSTVQRRAEFHDDSQKVVRSRVYHGIRVHVQPGGEVSLFDLDALMAWVIGAVVLLGLPRTLVLTFTISALGHTSKIYKRVIYEQFNIGEQVAGLVTRMMTNGVAFLELEDMQHGVSYKRMNERLREALKNESDELDDLEITQLVDFCYNAIVTPAGVTEDSSPYGLAKKYIQMAAAYLEKQRGRRKAAVAKAPKRTAPQSAHEHITIDDFLTSCASCDRVGFGDVVSLFDSNREMSLLERQFMPRYIRNNVIDRIAQIREAKVHPHGTRCALPAQKQAAQAAPSLDSDDADDAGGDMTVEDLFGDKFVPPAQANEALWHLTLEERKEALNMSHFKVEELSRKGEKLENLFYHMQVPHEEEMKETLDRLTEREVKVEKLVQRLTNLMGNMGSSLETTISKLGRCSTAPRTPRSEAADLGDAAATRALEDDTADTAGGQAPALHKFMQDHLKAEIELVEIRSQQREGEIAKSIHQTFDMLMQRLGRIEHQSGMTAGQISNGTAMARARDSPGLPGADGAVLGKFMELEMAMGSRLVMLERKMKLMAKTIDGAAASPSSNTSQWRQMQKGSNDMEAQEGGTTSGAEAPGDLAGDAIPENRPSFGGAGSSAWFTGAGGDGASADHSNRVGGGAANPPPSPPT